MADDCILCVDLGTTYCCAAVWNYGNILLIQSENENYKIPSYICFSPEGILYGEEAKNYANFYPELTVYGVKRMLGRSFNDEILQHDMEYWPFKVKEKNRKCYICIDYEGEEKYFRPEEIHGLILSNIKEQAEEQIGHRISKAIITVPANFNDSQRQATMVAAKIAGLEVKKIINEPTAAAIAYGLNNNANENENILVIDLGGGTTDISLFTMHNGNIEVKATGGDHHIGGEDFDNRLFLHFINEFQKKYNINLSEHSKALRRLKSKCEKIKCDLSYKSRANLSLDLFYNNIDFYSYITRDRFEEMNIDLFKKIIEVIDSVIKDSKIPKNQIQKIVLVGGSSKIPKIRSLIYEYFDGKKLYCNIFNETIHLNYIYLFDNNRTLNYNLLENIFN